MLEYKLKNFKSALKNVNSKLIIFKLIKLQTIGTYEYSKHLTSIHQREIRRAMYFISLLLANSIPLLGYKHGIKLFRKTYYICP